MAARWKDGSKGMLTVNALFAGFSGALTVNIAVRPWEESSLEMMALILGIAALYCFALGAERITDALDEGDVDTYLQSMLTYNVGVVLVLGAIAVYLWATEHPRLGILAGVLTLYPWVYHAGWLIFASKTEKDEYRRALLVDE